MVKCLNINEQLFNYTITGIIGIGGNSIIYHASHPIYDRVLIKEHIYAKDQYSVYRNANDQIVCDDPLWQILNQNNVNHENQNLGLLNHTTTYGYYDPKIDTFIWNHNYYTVLKPIDGQLLKDITFQNIQEVYEITIQLVEAIKALHLLGYLHLDLAEDNILLTNSNQINLLDFGSMQKKDQIDGYLLSQKKDYTSQEVQQAIDHPINAYCLSRINEKSDIYAIGQVMLQFLERVENLTFYSKQVEVYRDLANQASLQEVDIRINEDDLYGALISNLQWIRQYDHQLNRWIKEHSECVKKQNNPFDYRNRNHLFVGRKQEKEILEHFQDQSIPFSYMSICGPAGSGKTSLVYHYFLEKALVSKDWRYLLISADELDELDQYSTIITNQGYHLMIAIDYIPKTSIEAFNQFLFKLYPMHHEYKIRIVLIDREYHNRIPEWITSMKIYQSIQEIYYQNLYLDTLGQQNIYKIIDSVGNFSENENQIIYEKLISIDSYQRPIFALFLANLALQGIDYLQYISNSNQVLDSIIEKEIERLKAYSFTKYKLLLRWYVKATATRSLDYEELTDQEIEYLEAGEIDTHFLKEWLMYMNHSNLLLEGLVPDILGEYFILYYMHHYLLTLKSKKEFVSQLWQLQKIEMYETFDHMIMDFYHHDFPLIKELYLLLEPPVSLLLNDSLFVFYHDFYDYIEDLTLKDHLTDCLLKQLMNQINQFGLSNTVNYYNQKVYEEKEGYHVKYRIAHLLILEFLYSLLIDPTAYPQYIPYHQLVHDSLDSITSTQKFYICKNLTGIYIDLGKRELRIKTGKKAMDIYLHESIEIEEGRKPLEYQYFGVAAYNIEWLQKSIKLYHDPNFYPKLKALYPQEDITHLIGHNLAKIISDIGAIYYHYDHLDTALSYYQQSLALRIQNNYSSIDQCYYQIMLVYLKKKNYDQVLDYYQKYINEINDHHLLQDHISLSLFDKQKVFSVVARAFSSIVSIYILEKSLSPFLIKEANAMIQFCNQALNQRMIKKQEVILLYIQQKNLISEYLHLQQNS